MSNSLHARYTCERAEDGSQRAMSDALVKAQYGEQLGLRTPAHDRCTDAQTVVLGARDGKGELVATMTLQSAAFEPSAPAQPLELEASHRLDGLGISRLKLAEIRRVAARPGCARAMVGLYAQAAELCHDAGIETWLGLVEAHGGRPSDAAVVQRVLEAHGLIDPDLPLLPRVPGQLYHDHFSQALAAIDPEQLRRVQPPRRIAAFCRQFHARAISVVGIHPCFPRLVVAMRADLSDFAPGLLKVSRTTRGGDRR